MVKLRKSNYYSSRTNFEWHFRPRLKNLAEKISTIALDMKMQQLHRATDHHRFHNRE
jgi:hypothetical protein